MAVMRAASLKAPSRCGAAKIQRENRRPRCGGIETRKLPQRHILERAPDGGVDALPCAAHTAQTLDAALTRSTAAFGDGDRAFEGVQNLRRGDELRIAREPIATLRTARGNYHSGALQPFQYLAHRGPAETRALGQFR